MSEGDRFDDRQTQAMTVSPCEAAVMATREWFSQCPDFLVGETASGVGDYEYGLGGGSTRGDSYLAARIIVADGVADEVGNRLTDEYRVSDGGDSVEGAEYAEAILLGLWEQHSKDIQGGLS